MGGVEPYLEVTHPGVSGSLGWECLQCGALVRDKDAHSRWHETMAIAATDARHGRAVYDGLRSWRVAQDA